jgi:hypothetical protein
MGGDRVYFALNQGTEKQLSKQSRRYPQKPSRRSNFSLVLDSVQVDRSQNRYCGGLANESCCDAAPVNDLQETSSWLALHPRDQRAK